MHFWQCGTGSKEVQSATCTVANSTYCTITYIITVILPFLLHFYFELKIYAIFQSCYFSDISDDCKFCTIIDRNFKFSRNANLLVYCSAHRKEHLTCMTWHVVGVGMPWKWQKFIHFFASPWLWHSVLPFGVSSRTIIFCQQ